MTKMTKITKMAKNYQKGTKITQKDAKITKITQKNTKITCLNSKFVSLPFVNLVPPAYKVSQFAMRRKSPHMISSQTYGRKLNMFL